MKNIQISQSIIKEVEKDSCKLALKKYIDRVAVPPSEAMLSGLYFEHHLIGATRDGKTPEFKPLKNGNKPKAQLDLDLLVENSRRVFIENNIEIHEQQPEYKFQDVVAHLDAVGVIDGEKCIIDVKWTATKEDQRYNGGWADVMIKEDALIQAVHYVYTYLMSEGKKLPFYFLVFGKSGWIKKIRLDIDDEKLQKHEERINETREFLQDQIKNNFKHEANYSTCLNCRYKESCKSFSYSLKTEQFDVWL